MAVVAEVVDDETVRVEGSLLTKGRSDVEPAVVVVGQEASVKGNTLLRRDVLDDVVVLAEDLDDLVGLFSGARSCRAACAP